VKETNPPLNSKGIYLVLDFFQVKFFVQSHPFSTGGKSPRYLATQTLSLSAGLQTPASRSDLFLFCIF
jgi:hypothetical protein